MTSVYFRFVQFSLGVYEGKEFLDGSALKGFDWAAFYEFAKKQTLVGVVFDGIQKLPKDVAPHLVLLMRWLGMSQRIKQRNERMNEATVDIYNKVKAAGYSCCILKGQGNPRCTQIHRHAHQAMLTSGWMPGVKRFADLLICL